MRSVRKETTLNSRRTLRGLTSSAISVFDLLKLTFLANWRATSVLGHEMKDVVLPMIVQSFLNDAAKSTMVKN
jgi:hypothetical protein